MFTAGLQNWSLLLPKDLLEKSNSRLSFYGQPYLWYFCCYCQLVFFCMKVLEASALPLMFIKKTAIWICVAEKTSPAVGPANFSLSWICGPQKIHMKIELLIHSHTFLSLFLGGGKAAGAKYWRFMTPWSLTALLCVRLVTSDKACVLFVPSLEMPFTCL